MKVWGKKANKVGKGVALAALEGAGDVELVREVLEELAALEGLKRAGVWLEEEFTEEAGEGKIGGFHGSVWERAEEAPREWTHLSVEPPLPQEQLLRGKAVEVDLGKKPADPILGLLGGLRHALWVPVLRKENLKGVVLAGSQGKISESEREEVRRTARALSLGLERRAEKREAERKQEDFLALRELLTGSKVAGSPEELLAGIVRSCTEAQRGGEAVFAAIGELRRKSEDRRKKLEFPWRSGDESWTRAMERGEHAAIWERALETRQVTGSEPQSVAGEGKVERIVAFPLSLEGEVLGILVAGFRGEAASLAMLERMEWKTLLAARALRERRQTQESSRHAQLPGALLSVVREGVLLLDETGKVTAASRGARELAGTPAEMFGKWFRWQDGAAIEKWLHEDLQKSQEARATKSEKTQAELQNGAAVRLTLETLGPGQPRAVLLEPLGDGEWAEEGSNARIELKNVIEWVEEGIVLFDARDNVRAMNTRFEQIAGLGPEESGKYRTFEALVNRMKKNAAQPEAFAARWQDLARGIEGGVREELQMAQPSARVLERAARPVLDPIGRLLGRVETYRDLTAQRVFHSKLLQTEKLAALGQMVSGVAHELSNPLTSIMGYAHRLLGRQELGGRSEEIRQIYQEADRASTILRQLLLNARETQPERRLMSLNQIVHRAMDLQRFSLAAEKIRVELNLDLALPFVHGDAGHLQQVLMNLLGNARQAIEQRGDGGVIRVATRRIGEKRVQLEISDDGPGIPQAILGRIFDPFFTTKPVGVGTGLGLAIVLSVVREHGGQVNVTSPPQGGAIFKIELPAAEETAENEGAAIAARWTPHPEEELAGRPKGAASRESGKNTRVLVVEDEPTVARLIADVLEDEGMNVEVLFDGREALERAGRQTFDLVICDMKMPGLDGQHFYKSLERTGNALHERFLFVTGDIVAAQTREFLERNHLPHVAKPFRVEELTEKVHGVLELRMEEKTPAAKTAKKISARNG